MLKHPQIINSVNLKQVEVKENESAVDNLFIFTIMEINEAIDDAQTESQLRGKFILIYERSVESVYLNIRDRNQRDRIPAQRNQTNCYFATAWQFHVFTWLQIVAI